MMRCWLEGDFLKHGGCLGEKQSFIFFKNSMPRYHTIPVLWLSNSEKNQHSMVGVGLPDGIRVTTRVRIDELGCAHVEGEARLYAGAAAPPVITVPRGTTDAVLMFCLYSLDRDNAHRFYARVPLSLYGGTTSGVSTLRTGATLTLKSVSLGFRVYDDHTVEEPDPMHIFVQDD